MSNTLAIVQPEEDKILAGQLTAQYRKAVGGITEVVIFGAMMIALDKNLSARGHVSKGGRGNKDGISEWMRENAPDISRPTAYRFKSITEGLAEEFSLKTVDIPHLLTAPESDLTPALQKKRKAVEDAIEGKSQRQLILDFSIGKAEQEERGGKRNKKNPKLTPDQQLKVDREMAVQDLATLHDEIESFFIGNADKKWSLCPHKDQLRMNDLLARVSKITAKTVKPNA